MKEYKKRFERAKKLKRGVKHDYTSKKSSAFTVGKNKHSVMYKHDKKSWSCDCKWNSMRGTFCSHILAVNLFLNEHKKIMEKVKK
jgi:hypothetical protein